MDAVKQLGAWAAGTIALSWFVTTQLWPWIKERQERLEKDLAESYRDNKQMAREFTAAMERSNDNNREFARQFKLIAEKSRSQKTRKRT